MLSRRELLKGFAAAAVTTVIAPFVSSCEDQSEKQNRPAFEGETRLTDDEIVQTITEANLVSREDLNTRFTYQMGQMAGGATKPEKQLTELATGPLHFLKETSGESTATLSLQIASFSNKYFTDLTRSWDPIQLVDTVNVGFKLPVDNKEYQALSPLGRSMAVCAQASSATFVDGLSLYAFSQISDLVLTNENGNILALPQKLTDRDKLKMGFQLLATSSDETSGLAFWDLVGMVGLLQQGVVYGILQTARNNGSLNIDEELLQRTPERVRRVADEARTIGIEDGISLLQYAYDHIYYPVLQRDPAIRLPTKQAADFFKTPGIVPSLFELSKRLREDSVETQFGFHDNVEFGWEVVYRESLAA
ncbi:hypothetical protein HY468_00525 [Candidatus Roizmanbacteria bacterium]|nr:hypothetical protein [Candidatus Roizmanbacteria bacterium]